MIIALHSNTASAFSTSTEFLPASSDLLMSAFFPVVCLFDWLGSFFHGIFVIFNAD